MASLKELQTRINSVKSTRKITSAMKMVAASRLKKAQDAVVNAKEYNRKLEQMYAITMHAVNEYSKKNEFIMPKIVTGVTLAEEAKAKHLVVIHSSDRGLCGGFNATVAKFTRTYIKDLQDKGKDVSLMFVGRKAKDLLKSEYSDLFVNFVVDDKHLNRAADSLGVKLLDMYVAGEIDEVSVVYNKFISAIAHEPKADTILPVTLEQTKQQIDDDSFHYNFEPNLDTVLIRTAFSLLRNRLYRAEVESMASEQGARMTSMDSSTRNAGDIIDRLTLTYNRRRQAAITTELVEIIAGAEAV